MNWKNNVATHAGTAKKVTPWARSIAVLWLALSIISCGNIGKDDRELVEVAKTYIEKGDLRAAAIELRNAIQKNSSNGEARYLLGSISLLAGDAAAAEKEYGRAVKAGWEEEDSRIGLAQALLMQNKYKDLLKNVEIKETYSADTRANLLAMQAIAEAATENEQKSKETLKAAENLSGNAYHVLKNRIRLSLIKHELDASKKYLDIALKQYPDDQPLLLLQASFASMQGDAAAAKDSFQNVIDLDAPGFMSIYGRRARLAYVRLEILDGNFDHASELIGPVFGGSINDPEAYYLYGMIAFRQKQYDAAEQQLLSVLSGFPDYLPAQLLIGMNSYAQEEYEQTVYYLSKYVFSAPDNLEARKLLARTYMLLNQNDEAKELLSSVSDKVDGDIELLTLASISEIRSGDKIAGIKGLERAVGLAPDNTRIRTELARGYISAGNPEKAIESLQELIASGTVDRQSEALLIEAHMRANEAEKAVSVALKMQEKYPDDPEVKYLAGVAYTASDDKKSRAYFEKALSMQPDYLPAAMALGSIEEKEGHYDKAEALYKSLVDEGTWISTPLLALARLAKQRGDDDAMIDWLEQARQKAPEAIKPRLILAEYYVSKNKLDKAEMVVDEAIKLDSSQAYLLALQGRLLSAQHRYNEALLPLYKLIKKTPDDIRARLLLGNVLLRLGQIQDAGVQLHAALKKNPDNIVVMMLLIEIEMRNGDFDEALKYSQRIQKLTPDSQAGFELEGNIWVARQRWQDAEIAYTKAWALKKNAALAIKRAEIAHLLGKKEEGFKRLKDWLKTDPDNLDVRNALALAYQQAGQMSDSVLEYKMVLKASPQDKLALNNLAWLYMLEDNPEAQDVASRVYALDPENPSIQDTYGWILVQQGDIKKGRRLLKQAMKTMSENPDVRYHYAVALVKSGDALEGKKQLKALLDENVPFEGRADAQKLLSK